MGSRDGSGGRGPCGSPARPQDARGHRLAPRKPSRAWEAEGTRRQLGGAPGGRAVTVRPPGAVVFGRSSVAPTLSLLFGEKGINLPAPMHPPCPGGDLQRRWGENETWGC